MQQQTPEYSKTKEKERFQIQHKLSHTHNNKKQTNWKKLCFHASTFFFSPHTPTKKITFCFCCFFFHSFFHFSCLLQRSLPTDTILNMDDTRFHDYPHLRAQPPSWTWKQNTPQSTLSKLWRTHHKQLPTYSPFETISAVDAPFDDAADVDCGGGVGVGGIGGGRGARVWTAPSWTTIAFVFAARRCRYMFRLRLGRGLQGRLLRCSEWHFGDDYAGFARSECDEVVNVHCWCHIKICVNWQRRELEWKTQSMFLCSWCWLRWSRH